MPSEKHSVDELMRNVASTLVRDFRAGLDDPSFCSDLFENLKRRDIAGIRASCPSPSDADDVPTYKAKHQMAHLLKRYRFEKDLFSDNELVEKSISAFHETQSRIRAIQFDSLSEETQRVLVLARIYIADTLGMYDDEEHRNLCRFGRRASVGIPSRKASEAERWELPISGSQNQIAWFDSEMSQVDCIQEYWIKQLDSDPDRSIYQQVDFLTLTLVPKTFKSFRSIMPNTTIGGYMSYGLGEMIRKRLKRKGYDIATLQERHKYLARRGSEHGMFVTADLSSASDSISVALVNRLLPKDWSDILNLSRIPNIQLPDGSIIESETFCTMGIGYTFPLQTLVFLSLLKAVHFLLLGKRARSTISVYGDDMIYISHIHQKVVETFEELGFVINLDKTYHVGHFRESCGGDFFHGVDVRPFCPQNGSAFVGPKPYEAVLYKLINGLLMRWSEYEVPDTVRFLLSEIGRVNGKARIVPPDFPDDSGIKTCIRGSFEFLRGRSDVAWPKHIGHGVFRFSFLRLVPEQTKEERHEPYLWSALRGSSPPVYYDGGGTSRVPDTSMQLLLTVTCNVSGYVPPLKWVEHGNLSTRSKISGRRLRRLFSTVTVSHTGKYKRQYGTSCFGVPQNCHV